MFLLLSTPIAWFLRRNLFKNGFGCCIFYFLYSSAVFSKTIPYLLRSCS
jgi:hypothetical protein